MFIALSKRQEVADAQKQLKEALYSQLPARDRSYTIGFQGGNMEVANLRANGSIWCILDKTSDDSAARYWNAFGLSESLKVSVSNVIVVEINVPISGYNGNVAGLFARDENGNTWLLHSGKIGGGRKGVGKEAFLNFTKLATVSVGTESGVVALIPIARLGSSTIAADVARFVRNVARFKDSVSQIKISGLPSEELETLAKKGKKKPSRVLVESLAFVRDPFVVAFVKRRAKGQCELCGQPAPFLDGNGVPFLECHHIQWLSEGGDDRATNACALCPNCHRKMHVVNHPDDVKKLRTKAAC